MTPVDAIIPAHNESGRVGNVVRAVIAAQVFRSVTVVDDGSTDSTATEAGQAGARVLSLRPNRGKGQAMLAAVSALPRDGSRVAFFDADLLGFLPEHAQHMLALSDQGYDMVCGLRQYGWMRNVAQVRIGPLITGERIVRRWILERLPLTCWNGYRIEVAMNDVVSRNGGTTCLTFLKGVNIVDKTQKTGVLKGLTGQAKMFAEIARTRRALKQSGGHACEI